MQAGICYGIILGTDDSLLDIIEGPIPKSVEYKPYKRVEAFAENNGLNYHCNTIGKEVTFILTANEPLFAVRENPMKFEPPKMNQKEVATLRKFGKLIGKEPGWVLFGY